MLTQKRNLLGGIGIGFLLAVLCFWLVGSLAHAQPQTVPQRIAAHEFILLDSSDRVVGQFKPSADGKGILQFFSPDGRVIWSAPGPRAFPATK